MILVVTATTTWLITWFVFGKSALLERDVEMIWTDRTIVQVGKQYEADLPQVFCTNLTYNEAVERYGRPARVLTMDECFGEENNLLGAIEMEIVSPDSELGLIIGAADARLSTPIVTKNDVYIWFYGTDYLEYREEWLTWFFVGWVSVCHRDGGLGAISSDKDA